MFSKDSDTFNVYEALKFSKIVFGLFTHYLDNLKNTDNIIRIN